MTDYTAMATRIRKAYSLEEINKLDNSLYRLYNNGIFTVGEFSRLDDLLFKQQLKIEE